MPRPLLIILACLISVSQAHDSPSHTLEQLNKHIAKNPSPTLLFQRALAYKALGKIDLAAADIKAATDAKPNNSAWQIQRVRIELAANRPQSALAVAKTALTTSLDNRQQIEIYILQSQAYQSLKKYQRSLDTCELAFKKSAKPDLDWYLLRSQNQHALGLEKQRLTDLKKGLTNHPNSILKPHYVDALIDAGKHSEAITIIEKELPTLRWKSHWQVKQARALIGLNRTPEAHKKLYAALHEIYGRLNPHRPDIFLLADQAQIQLLLGDKTSAHTTLKQLKKHQAPTWLTSRLETQNSKSQTPKPK